MTQKDKELLLKDLCARLPYGVKVQCITESARMANASPLTETLNTVLYRYVEEDNIELKPYLRPMSSMTEDERHELIHFGGIVRIDTGEVIDVSCLGFKHHANNQDWLNAHHFDYRGLIPMDLALEAKEGMYNIK
jgi:hypothetical protein